jgi:hypothetical protein
MALASEIKPRTRRTSAPLTAASRMVMAGGILRHHDGGTQAGARGIRRPGASGIPGRRQRDVGDAQLAGARHTHRPTAAPLALNVPVGSSPSSFSTRCCSPSRPEVRGRLSSGVTSSPKETASSGRRNGSSSA